MKRALIASVAALLLCLACGPTVLMPVHTRWRDVGASEEAQAGVAEVDITPPPGLSFFGHGPEGRIAEGASLRLHCTAYVFVAARSHQGSDVGKALAWVPCELPAPTLILQRAVATKLVSLGVPLGAESLAISATHTHAAPGHYFPFESYSGPMSGRRLGFDPQVVDFLASRIACAVARAYRERSPARWGWGTRTVFGLTRNRAYSAFSRNRVVPPELVAQRENHAFDPTLRAIDPQLSLLRIERKNSDGEYKPYAALVVFGIHPTVINNRNALYTGDVFGYAARAMRRSLEQRHGVQVTVAYANGIEGDATSVRHTDTPDESRRVGMALADESLHAWRDIDPTAFPADSIVDSAYRDIDFSAGKLSDGRLLAALPIPGAPLGGGANDHPTGLRSLAPINPGVRTKREAVRGHGPKFPIQSISETVAGKHFPSVAPITTARLGNGLVVMLPAELTTTVGMALRQRVKQIVSETDAADNPVVVVGLTNEYLQYIASADEYTLQHYEGASTLYGPNSGDFVAEQAVVLTRSLFDVRRHAESPGSNAVNVAARVRVFPSTFHAPLWARVSKQAAGPPAVSAPHFVVLAGGERAVQGELSGVAPDDTRDPDTFRIALRHHQVLVEDERGMNLRTIWSDERHTWSLQWVPPTAELVALCDQPLTWHVRTRRGSWESPSATLECGLAGSGREP